MNSDFPGSSVSPTVSPLPPNGLILMVSAGAVPSEGSILISEKFHCSGPLGNLSRTSHGVTSGTRGGHGGKGSTYRPSRICFLTRRPARGEGRAPCASESSRREEK